MSIQNLGALGYKIAVLFTIMGLYFCLSPYLMPKDLHHQISLWLYDEAYTTQALPALASFSWTELTHRLFGAIFLVLGLFQFNKEFRRKNKNLHRTLGKVYFVFCFTAAISGFIFAFFIPFGGLLETFIIGFFSSLMLYFTYRAWTAIKAKDFEQHEQFSRYTYAIGLGIVTIRLIAYVLLFGTDIPDGSVLNISLIAGWALTLWAAHYYTIKKQEEKATSVVAQ